MVQPRTTTRVIARDVIKVLGVAGAISMVVVAPNSTVLIDKYMKSMDKRNARRTLSYLKYRRLIDVKKVGNEYHYRLSDKGLIRYKQIALDELSIPSPRRWDGKWRLVMFDIPVKFDRRRRILIDKLNQMDFYMLQQSAWIHPFDGELQIGILLKNLELERYVSFLVVERSNFTDHAIAHFKQKRLLM